MTVDIHGHRFEIYTLASEIHENIDLVLGIKNVVKLEGVINTTAKLKQILQILREQTLYVNILTSS